MNTLDSPRGIPRNHFLRVPVKQNRTTEVVLKKQGKNWPGAATKPLSKCSFNDDDVSFLIQSLCLPQFATTHHTLDSAFFILLGRKQI